MKKKNSLLEAIYANGEDLLAQVKVLLDSGANPNEKTRYFETPLRVSSRNGRFDVVKCLFEAGADPAHLNWSLLFHAIAYGTLEDIKKRIEEGDDLHARDTWERTPFLLSLLAGDVKNTQYLILSGANIADRGRCDQSPIEYAIQMDDAEMLEFLVANGFSIETYNEFGYTPLMEAAELGSVSCVRALIQQGANVFKRGRSQFSQNTAISYTSNMEIVELLLAAGNDISELNDEARKELLGIGRETNINVTDDEYFKDKSRVFGESNPQLCNKKFWHEMIRCAGSAWLARVQFNDTDSLESPIWCYERFGKSITAIGQGEFIEIAGEHEDYYDSDFCIYNEVFHHKDKGDFTVYQYPKSVFPPTDFHTATLVENFIYIIGNLGYIDERVHGWTPVYRLNIKTFEIEKVETFGELPGWIFKHTAFYKDKSTIRIQGGEVFEIDGDENFFRFNRDDFELNLESFVWSRHVYDSRFGIQAVFSEAYKRFEYAEQTLLSIEENGVWLLRKIIKVHRIDVFKGQCIRLGKELVDITDDDFLFVVAYVEREPFDSYVALKKAIKQKAWSKNSIFTVSRTITFPGRCRPAGFEKISKPEIEMFNRWEKDFAEGKAEIL